MLKWNKDIGQNGILTKIAPIFAPDKSRNARLCVAAHYWKSKQLIKKDVQYEKVFELLDWRDVHRIGCILGRIFH